MLLGIGSVYFLNTDKNLDIEEEKHTSFIGKGGIEVTKNSNLFITVFGGMYKAERKKVDDLLTNTGERIFEPYTDKSTKFFYGGGISYFLPHENLMFSIDYDNVRKLTGSVGFCWKF